MKSTEEVAAQVAEWQKTIDEIRRKAGQADEMVRSMGIDPEKLRSLIGPKELEEARRIVAQDLADAEREVEQAKVPSKSTLGRKLRKMV